MTPMDKVRWLRSEGHELLRLATSPRVHPNGFIQLDLDEAHRLHVWHPRLPYRQDSYSPIHNHIFNFDSLVLTGRLVNVRYEPIDMGIAGPFEHWAVEAIEGQNTILAPTGKLFDLVAAEPEVIWPGNRYIMKAGDFHETLANEPTATVMTKVGGMVCFGPNCLGAGVMVPKNEKADNEFRRDSYDSELLWELIDETLNRGDQWY